MLAPRALPLTPALVMLLACRSAAPPPALAAPAAPPVDAKANAPMTPAARGRAFIALLEARRFDEAHAALEDKVGASLTAAKLEAAWRSVRGDAGKLLRASVDHEQGAAASLACDFERGTVVARVRFDEHDKMVALWFGPLEPTWTAPPYADLATFTERDLEVGPAPRLFATLTTPRAPGKHAIAVLVHGSGPADRDESATGSKLFKDLAWGLASRGVAVLRYEKRTRQHAGSLAGKAITMDDETILDARAIAREAASLPDVDPARVFLVGHSMGAALAPRIASKEPAITGLVMLAGNTRPVDRMLRDQFRYLMGLEGASEDAIKGELAKIDAAVAKARAPGPEEELIHFGGAPLPRSYILAQLAEDPIKEALAIRVPMFVAQGERDYQVTAADDFAGWQKGLAGKTNVAFRLYPALNHHFVAGSGQPTPKEYATPGHADARLVGDLADWITTGRVRP